MSAIVKPPLPDCMMPDGADPCKAFQWLQAENERLLAELAAERERCADLVKKYDAVLAAMRSSARRVLGAHKT
jgi:phage shock protein A